jgi:hypothetical protein
MSNPLEIKYLPLLRAAAAEANAASTTPMPAWYPGCAAAEAWCETGGTTRLKLPRLADGTSSYNCLGIKAGRHYTGRTVTANGTEQLASGAFTDPTPMNWRVYPGFAECFADQIRLLHTQRDASGLLHYQKALDATTPEEYMATEPWAWSTNQSKSADVLATWKAHQDLLRE